MCLLFCVLISGNFRARLQFWSGRNPIERFLPTDEGGFQNNISLGNVNKFPVQSCAILFSGADRCLRCRRSHCKKVDQQPGRDVSSGSRCTWRHQANARRATCVWWVHQILCLVRGWSTRSLVSLLQAWPSTKICRNAFLCKKRTRFGKSSLTLRPTSCLGWLLR